MVTGIVLESVIREVTTAIAPYFDHFFVSELLNHHYHPSPSEDRMDQIMSEWSPEDDKSSTEWISFQFNRSNLDTSDFPDHRGFATFLHDKDERRARDMYEDYHLAFKLCQFNMSMIFYSPSLEVLENLEELVAITNILPQKSVYTLLDPDGNEIPEKFVATFNFGGSDYNLTQMPQYTKYGTMATLELSTTVRFPGIFFLGKKPLIRHLFIDTKVR